MSILTGMSSRSNLSWRKGSTWSDGVTTAPLGLGLSCWCNVNEAFESTDDEAWSRTKSRGAGLTFARCQDMVGGLTRNFHTPIPRNRFNRNSDVLTELSEPVL